jgi:putative membrane protein
MRKYTIFVSTLLLSGGLLFAQAPTSSSDTGSSAKPATAKKSAGTRAVADNTFAKKAAEGGLTEVELGKLATEKASNPDVKAFGQRMVDDHSKANDQLKGIAGQQNITLPTDLNAKHKAERDRLSKLSGEAFDHAYINHMVLDHKKDIAEFQKEANSGKNDAIKNFASQTLPTLQDHLKQAQDAQKSAKASAANTGKGTSASADHPQ